MAKEDVPAIEPETTVPGAAAVAGVALLVVATVLLVWKGSLSGEFLFDDENLLYSPAVEQIQSPLVYLRNNRPLGLFSFALNHAVAGFNLYGLHVTNLAIHTLNTLLLFAGVYAAGRLLHSRRAVKASAWTFLGIATVIALLWGCHPLTTQAVTYIIQRYESMASTGYLLAWCGWLFVAGRQRAVGGVVLLIGAWIGVLTKEIAATAPLVLILFDRAFFSASWKQVIKTRWWAIAIVCSPYIWFLPSVARWFFPREGRATMGFGLEQVTAWEYLRTQPEVILHYIRLAFWPSDLCFDYAWQIQNNSLVYLPLGLIILALVASSACCYVIGCRREPNGFTLRLSGWAGLSFFLMLAPTSSFMPIFDLCVEHRMYLPLSVLVAVTVLGINALMARLPFAKQVPRVATLGTLVAAFAVTAVLSWQTIARNRDYASGTLLWAKTFQARPHSARAALNLATALSEEGRHDVAHDYFRTAVALAPKNAVLQLGLARSHKLRGDYEDAIEHIGIAISLEPRSGKAFNELGDVYYRQGQFEKAAEAFVEAAECGEPGADYNRAQSLIAAGQKQDAIEVLSGLLDDPIVFQPAVVKLAWMLSTESDETLRDGERAIEVLRDHFDVDRTTDVNVVDAYAAALAETGQYSEAVAVLSRGLESLDELLKGEPFVETLQKRLACYRGGQPWRVDPQ